MSLLEDVFLQDEAGEAQELERIIEGDDYDERPRDRSDSDENSEKEDEAEEDKRRVDPASTKTKRVVRNPRFILNPARLTGPRGMQVLPEHFKDFKFKGKGHEKEDLDLVLKKLEHWAYRLYPKFTFEDCLKKIETLGKKQPVMVHLHKIRSDQMMIEETVVQQDSSDDEAPPPQEDEFDKLLAQQIELARTTPGPGSVRKPGFGTPLGDKISPITMPKATSSPSINDEQRDRMMKNRKLAEERRLARLKAQTLNGNTVALTNDDQNRSDAGKDTVAIDVHPVDDDKGEEIRTRKNRSHIIDSSDSDNMVIDENMIDTNDIPISNEVIDITNGYKSINKTLEKTYMPSVVESVSAHVSNYIIDITDGYQSKERVTQENIDNIVTVDPEIIEIAQEQNNKMIIKATEVIDLNEKERVTLQNKKLNISDSSDSDNDFAVARVKESITVDVHKNASQSHIQNKFDSENRDKDIGNYSQDSDDDIAITTVNESITVDVHNNASQIQKDSEDRDNDIENYSHDNDDEIEPSISQSRGLYKESKSNMKPDYVLDKIKVSETNEIQPNLSSDVNKKDKGTIKENVIVNEETNLNNGKTNANDGQNYEEHEELMDINFSDDF